MQVPYYSIEVISTTGKTIDIIDRPISLAAARSFGTVGNATITLPPDLPETIFQFNLRFKIWRTGHNYTPHLFGDTVWLLRRFRNAVSAGHHVIEAVDAMALLGHPVVAYTARTPYADKTLEENQDVVFDESYRIDNLMRQYVRENMGPDALDTNRRNAYIVVEEDTNFGPYGEKQAAWAKLDSVLSDLARMSAEKGTELFYDLIPHNEQFLFRVWKDVRGKDRGIHSLNSLVFSDDMNDLDEIEVVDDYSNMGTYCYALGYDSGPSQIVVEMSNEEALRADPFGRVEFTTNASDSDVESVLEATAQAAIFGRRPRRTISAKLAGGALMLYGDQFVYGDKVGVQALGRKYNCQVNAVATRWEDGEENLEVRLNGSEELFAPSWRRDNWFVPPQHPEDTSPDPDPDPLEPIPPPSSGLVEGQEQVAAINLDGYLYRTNDFQTLSSAGGPTWDRVDTGIAETLYSWVVDPFSPGYINGAGAINGWIASENAIYRVADIFGTPVVTAVHTFATAASAASYHWRGIQASFGTYFPEGDNPWLLCISYYGSTSGKEGTWATYSIDGGATWAAEVQVSEFYDSNTPNQFNPIGVYASPKTPGLAYTAAYIDPAEVTPGGNTTDGYMSTDWGATWTRLTQPVVEDPDQRNPVWWAYSERAGYRPVAGAWSVTDTSLVDASLGASSFANLQEDRAIWRFYVIPPANTKRIVVKGVWYVKSTTESPTLGSQQFLNNWSNSVGGDFTTLQAYESVVLVRNVPILAAFTVELSFNDFATEDWPTNLDNVSLSNIGGAPSLTGQTQAVQAAGASVHISANLQMWVDEVELDDGTIYTPTDSPGLIQPGNAQAGSIHIPWPDNATEQMAYYGRTLRDYDGVPTFILMRNEGATATSVSPVSGAYSFGVNHYGFAVRTHDSNRQYALLAGMNNTKVNNIETRRYGVWVSSDGGDSWTQVVAPATGDGPYEAAFGGNSEQVLYIWGPAQYISYSDDMGATLDSKSGNLASFSPGRTIGIAGGPTA